MFAIALNLGFLGVVGVGAIVTAVLFLASHDALARGVCTLVLPLSIHASPLVRLQLTCNALQITGHPTYVW